MLTVDEIVAALKRLYTDSASLRAAWPDEMDALRAVVEALEVDVAGHYELDEPLGVGGSGVVLRARDVRLDVDRALKFSRPSPGKHQLLADFLSAETERLLDLNHPYLMPIHAKGSVESVGRSAPYYVMDLTEGADDSDDFVARDDTTEGDILQVIERSLEALAYMHGEGQVHLDLKPGNILVRPGNAPVVSDLGFAKVLQDDSGLTVIGGTEGFLHPGARRWIDEASSDPNRLRGEAVRSELKPSWDLYAFGKTIIRLLAVLEQREGPHPLSLYAQRFVKLLACRLLDGENSMDETILGLTQNAFQEVKYASAAEALLDIRKLTGNYSLEARIPELDQYCADTIQASTFATTPFTARVETLLQHSEMARLGGFTQLSLLNLVYPTATHTRLEHVIGTFSSMSRYLIALYRDPLNPLFRQLMTEEDMRAALVVALVHDIGHYGLAHDLEEAENSIFSHEDRGKELLRDPTTGLRQLIETEELPDGSPGWNVSVDRVIRILEAEVDKIEGSVKDRLIHALIDGPIDADKLDYIVRDSINLGLTYGAVIDVERLLRVLTVVSRQSGSDTYVNIGIHEKGRVTAEAVAFARYALYGSVYWHHAYRSIKAMLSRMAWEYLELIAEGDKQRKEGIGKVVTRDLYSFLRTESGGAPQTLPLTSLVGGDQIHPGDRGVLEWLGGRSGPVGRSLMDLLEQRQLFKRVLVISQWGNDPLWRKITDLMSDHDWRRKLAFQRAVQDQLASEVQTAEVAGAHTTMVIPDERNALIAAASRGTPVVLVDATQPRPGASSGLELVQEEDRRRAKIDEIPTSRPEESRVWDSIGKNLHESLGKVRVLCHPEHARFVSALNRELIEDVLERAIAQS